MLRNPHCLDDQLTGGGKVISLTNQPRSTPQKHYLSASGTHFCQRLSKLQGLVRLEGLGKLKNFNSHIGYSASTSTLLLASLNVHNFIKNSFILRNHD
jgi:hypothetical protein